MLNTLHSNEQKCRLVILVPLQTFRRLVFQYYRIVTRFAYAEIKEKVKKIKTLFVVRARLCHAAYQNFFPLFVSSLQVSRSQCRSMWRVREPSQLTEVILFAFFRIGRHFSCVHAYCCFGSYAPTSANKILIHHCIHFPVDGLEYQLVLSQVHIPRSYTRKVCLKIGLLEG